MCSTSEILNWSAIRRAHFRELTEVGVNSWPCVLVQTYQTIKLSGCCAGRLWCSLCLRECLLGLNIPLNSDWWRSVFSWNFLQRLNWCQKCKIQHVRFWSSEVRPRAYFSFLLSASDDVIMLHALQHATTHLDQTTRFKWHTAAAGLPGFLFPEGEHDIISLKVYHGFYLFNKASIKNDYITLWKHELATCSERLLHHHSGRFMTCLGFITFFLTAKEQILLNFPAFSGNDYMIGAPDYFW